MRRWLRLQDRVFGVFVTVLAVTSTIGCIVAVATAQWARLPVQLLVAVAAAFMFLVRRRAWSAQSVGTDGAALDPEAGAVAPTRAALVRDQAALDARGSQLSLIGALRAGSTLRD